MARNGFKIFDSDTHVGPVMDVLDPYLSGAEKAKLASWEQYKTANKRGHVTYTRGQRRYRRRLGTARPEESPGGYMAGLRLRLSAWREPLPEIGRIRAGLGHGRDPQAQVVLGQRGPSLRPLRAELARYARYTRHRWARGGAVQHSV